MADVDSSVDPDPGVYQQEVINPNSLALGQLVSLLAIVGIAPRNKTVFNEAVRRGQISNEAVTFALLSPHTYTLINRGNRRQQDTVLLKNGTDVMPDNSYQYLVAVLTGVSGPFVIPVGSFITLNLDFKGFISIPITAGGAQTAAAIAADINTALTGSPLYGPSYATVATVSGAAVRITSPLTASLPNSDQIGRAHV